MRLLDDIAPLLAWPVEIAGETVHPEHGAAELRHARALGVLDAAEMRQRLAEAAIYAAPARYEPFALGILEAAAAGCALALGDIASLRETWDGAAIFPPAEDAGRWRAALSHLIEDRGECRRLSLAARTRARHFTLARTALCYHPLYRALARKAADRQVALMARLALFCHSLRSDWNHGNAHFLRGVVSELGRREIAVRAFEPEDGWSARNLAADLGPSALAAWRAVYPDLRVITYASGDTRPRPGARPGSMSVLVHEWNDAALIARSRRPAAGAAPAPCCCFTTPTTTGMASAPDQMERLDRDGFDGVLAFGEALSEAYRRPCRPI